MKNPFPKTKHILITHVVGPHQFYFKYPNDCVNGEFSKFDYDIQRYGNDLYSQKTYVNGYSPAENELVIFFNIIFNKWIRGRVVSIDQEINVWCIDSGICEKCVAPNVLPLIPKFHEDLKLVHLGGLSLLPTEKILNVQTVEVETHLSKQWDEKTIKYFKGIVNTSKTFMFTEEFELTNHKFGVLAVESKYVAIKNVNNILLEMNNVAHSNQYAQEDLWPHVSKDRLQQQLYQSLHSGYPIRMANNKNVTASALSLRYGSGNSGSEMSLIENSMTNNEDFDDSVSRQSFDTSTMLEIETKSSGSSTITRSGLKPQAARCDNPREIESNFTNLSIQSKAEVLSSVANSEEQSLDDSVSTALSSSATAENSTSSSSSNSLNGSDMSVYECYLRTYKIDFSKELREPLESTMNWIKSNSTENSNNKRRTDQPSPNAPSTSTVKRRDMLASLVKKEHTTESTYIAKHSKKYTKHFGVPAGYAKNCLDTFGGLSSKK